MNNIMNLNSLTIEDLEKIQGGTGEEFRKYVFFLMHKYNIYDTCDLTLRASVEENAYAHALCNHQENQPYPNCPNPDFNLQC